MTPASAPPPPGPVQVVFQSSDEFGTGCYSVFNVVRGEDGSQVVSIDRGLGIGGGAYDPALVLADIGSGVPEALLGGSDLNNTWLVAVTAGGSFRKFDVQPAFPDGYILKAIEVVDLTGDGSPEIVMAPPRVLLADGSLLWDASSLYPDRDWLDPVSGCKSGEPCCEVASADLDRDGRVEVVAGPVVFDGATGQIRWQKAWPTKADYVPPWIPAGVVALGQFEAGPEAEIALVNDGELWLLRHDGNVIWGPVEIPGGSAFDPPRPPQGGPPTVADLDGDGQAEIVVAHYTAITALRGNGSVFWSVPINDYTSGSTGVTAFDFDSDGAYEVVNQDHEYWRIFDGRDGSVLYEICNRSRTGQEAPIILDVDGDGSAEVIVGSAEDGDESCLRGMRSYGNPAWAPAPPVWNQYSYRVTNVRDDLTIPAHEKPSWLLFNLWRGQPTMGRCGILADARGPAPACPGTPAGRAHVSARWSRVFGCPDVVYEWFRGANFIGSGIEADLDVAPPEDLRLVVRCPSAPGCQDEDSFSVYLVDDPIPPSIGPTLRLQRSGPGLRELAFTWAPLPSGTGGYEVVGHAIEGGPPASAVMESAAVLGRAADGESTTAIAGPSLPPTRLLYLKVRALSPCGRPGPVAD